MCNIKNKNVSIQGKISIYLTIYRYDSVKITSDVSWNLASMMIADTRSSHAIRQKSVTVCSRGPWAATYLRLPPKPLRGGKAQLDYSSLGLLGKTHRERGEFNNTHKHSIHIYMYIYTPPPSSRVTEMAVTRIRIGTKGRGNIPPIQQVSQAEGPSVLVTAGTWNGTQGYPVPSASGWPTTRYKTHEAKPMRPPQVDYGICGQPPLTLWGIVGGVGKGGVHPE